MGNWEWMDEQSRRGKVKVQKKALIMAHEPVCSNLCFSHINYFELTDVSLRGKIRQQAPTICGRKPLMVG